MRVTRCTLIMGLALMATSAVSAQSPANGSPAPRDRAAEFIAQAEQIYDLSRWLERARLYDQAAAHMSSDDSRLVELIARAGTTYYYGGRRNRAEARFRRAAVVAHQQKNSVAEADACLKLLILAIEKRDRIQVRSFIDRLVILAGSPTLPEVDRVTILRRISVPLATLSSASGH